MSDVSGVFLIKCLQFDFRCSKIDILTICRERFNYVPHVAGTIDNNAQYTATSDELSILFYRDVQRTIVQLRVCPGFYAPID